MANHWRIEYKSARAACAMETCCCSPRMRWPPGCLNGMKRGDHYGTGFTGSWARQRALPQWSPTAAKMDCATTTLPLSVSFITSYRLKRRRASDGGMARPDRIPRGGSAPAEGFWRPRIESGHPRARSVRNAQTGHRRQRRGLQGQGTGRVLIIQEDLGDSLLPAPDQRPCRTL